MPLTRNAVKQLSDAEEKNRQLSTKNFEARQEVDELKVSLSQAKSSYASLQSDLKQQDKAFRAEIKQLLADKSDLKEKLERLEVKSSNLEDTISSLRMELSQKNQTCEEKIKQLSDANEKIQKLSDENARLRGLNDKDGEINQLSEEISDAKENLEVGIWKEANGSLFVFETRT